MHLIVSSELLRLEYPVYKLVFSPSLGLNLIHFDLLYIGFNRTVSGLDRKVVFKPFAEEQQKLS